MSDHAPPAELHDADAPPQAVADPAPPDAAATPADAPADGLADTTLERLFNHAHTPRAWSAQTVPVELLHRLYDALRLGPTSANCSPARFVFLHSADARARILGALSGGNVERVRTAPVTVVVAHDPFFHEHLPRLHPHADARGWFAADAALAEETAFRNGTLQGAYLILAARALGLDAMPMSGFDNNLVDAQLLANEGWKSNFLVSLGYGVGMTPERAPRLGFDEACRLL